MLRKEPHPRRRNGRSRSRRSGNAQRLYLHWRVHWNLQSRPSVAHRQPKVPALAKVASAAHQRSVRRGNIVNASASKLVPHSVYARPRTVMATQTRTRTTRTSLTANQKATRVPTKRHLVDQQQRQQQHRQPRAALPQIADSFWFCESADFRQCST